MGDKLSPTLSRPDCIPAWMWDEVLEYRLPLAAAPRTVLDIGANIGAFTLLAQQLWPEALIHAFEPVDDNLAQLYRNVPESPRLIVHAAAVRGFNGPAEILLGDRGVTCSFHQLGRQTALTETCACVDAAELPSAEFVKIDTEGCEVEIFARLNLTDTKVLCIEYHRAEDIDKLIRHAAEQGFNLAHSHAKGTWGLLVFARPGALLEGMAGSPLPAAPKKLFVALPVYGGYDAHFIQSLLKLCNDPGCHLMLRPLQGDSLVPRARNVLTADFLASDATHLLFIDTDLVFSPEQVRRILAHDEAIVGGFYPKKMEGEVQWVCNGSLTPESPRPDGLVPVRYMGTGFLRVHRSVFEKMIAVYGPQLVYKPDHADRVEHDFWSVGTYQYPDGTRRYLSEDWFFCQRALDLGYTVWGDTRIILKHVGQAVYPLRSQEQTLFGALPATAAADCAGNGVIAPTDLAHKSSVPEPALA